MIDFLEICRRAASGPLLPESSFDRERFYPTLSRLIRKYEIRYDKENPVNRDDAVADAIFEAAVDLLSEVGVYCTDAQRIMEFSRDEVVQAVREAPGACWFGEGHERKLFRPRRPDDVATPSWCHVGSGVNVSSEEIAFKTVEGYARIAGTDSIAAPSLTQLRGIPVSGGSPQELLAAIRANEIARAALRQSGKPGMPILNLSSTAGSAVATVGSSTSDFGIRQSDGWLVGFLAEMKVDYGALAKAAYLTSWGGSIASESAPILGGYCGGPAGVAIANVAYILAGILVLKGSYQLTFPMDVAYSCSSSRGILWAVGASSQAISRHISYPVLSLCYASGGPMTESYFYESSAYLLTAIPSGSSAQTPIPAKALKVDHQTPLEMQFSAEVIRACHRIDREEANEIVKRLIERYEENLPNPQDGRRYQDCYDLVTGYPSREYLDMYGEMKEKISNMGVPLAD